MSHDQATHTDSEADLRVRVGGVAAPGPSLDARRREKD
jgi:hypothetical protein